LTDPIQKLSWRPAPATVVPQVPVWRDVPRVAFILAAICLVLGSLLPWAEGHEPMGGAVSFRATQGLGEGVILLAGAVMLLLLSRGRVMWETTSRTLQVLPIAFALIGAAMWLGIDNYARVLLVDWARRGGGGELTSIRWVAAMGLALTLIGSGWLERHRPPDVKKATGSLWQEWGLTRASSVTIAAALIFGLLGAAAGALAMVFVLGMEAILLALIVGIFGLFAGIAAGVRLGRAMTAVRRG